MRKELLEGINEVEEHILVNRESFLNAFFLPDAWSTVEIGTILIDKTGAVMLNYHVYNRSDLLSMYISSDRFRLWYENIGNGDILH